MHLRCTLMGGKSRYPIKYPSKQLNNRFFSTLINLPVSKLNSWFITGFADAEGCFSISIIPDARLKLKWGVSPAFIIKLHIKDFKILEKIKNTLEVGNIRKNGKDSVEYRVYSIKELQVIIDHKYPLITNKLSDYLIFKKCFELIKNGEHLNEKGLLKIINLKSSLNWGLSDKLKSNFPNIIPIQHAKKEFIFKGIPDPFWLSGFTSGDGSFHVVTRKTNSKVVVFTRFSIHLHIRELEIIKELSKIFKLYETEVTGKATATVENYNYYILNKSVILQITKNSDIVNTIIPFYFLSVV